jgi:predicted DNA-binding protein|tara:strand:+ start:767 stop:913 length:147 start_codon:yes stop_codon:yes gene_type:complete
MNRDNLTKQIAIRFGINDFSKLKEISSKKRLTTSSYIRNIVSEHLDQI